MLKPLFFVPVRCKGDRVVIVDENLFAGLDVANSNNTHDVAKSNHKLKTLIRE